MCFNSVQLFPIWMPGHAAVQTAISIQQVLWKKAFLAQRGILCKAFVSCGKHEPVAVFQLRIVGIYFHCMEIQRSHDINTGIRAAQVSRLMRLAHAEDLLPAFCRRNP